MSRFFAGSESESESESSDDEQLIAQKTAAARVAFAFSDEEEDTGRRIVRSAKDKRYDELKDMIKLLKNHKKIKDMAKVLTDFENLCKGFDKAKKVVDKEGVPRFYIKALVELEDFVNECWEDREGRKAMSKNNSKGLTTLRQKLRKYNRDFEKDLAKYRESPDQEGEEEQEEVSQEEMSSEESVDEDDDYVPNASADMFKKASPAEATKFLKGAAHDDLDEDSDEYWKSSGDSETESSDDDDAYGGDLRLKFLKKAPASTVDTEKRHKKDKEKKIQRVKVKEEEKEDAEEGWTEVQGKMAGQKEKPKMFLKDDEINCESVYKKLTELVSARGKKGTDRSEQIELLVELRAIAADNNLGPGMDAKILFNIIASIYDYNPNIATCMKSEIWERCLNSIEELLSLLESNPDIIAGENVADESENFEQPPYRVHGSILSQIERMDEEFTKILQACDAHSTEYVDRLKDEQRVCKIIEKLQRYLTGRGTSEELCRVYMKRIDHLYYKFDHLVKKDPEDDNDKKSSEELMDELCHYIFAKDVTDRLRTRAILCQIYHHALHDRWFKARDIMLMSHLQDTIQHSDIPTQIMYNRAMVQLGLCAFRQGIIKDAHNCLVDIQSTGRAKELLAQGLLLQRQHERTAEQEKIEKRRQMPYHKHINQELLECVYLVSAMLIEIPYMAAHEFDARRRLISKNFHHVMRVSDRQPLVGPPESMREHVVAASKAMKTGDWKACKNFIINEKMNAKVWDLFRDTDSVRELLVQKIQEESLRTYLFTYSQVYDSLSLVTLAEMFELDKAVVHSIISKMIINEELMASMDEPTQAVVMHRTEPSRLQSLALQLSEKVSSLVENNEKIMEMKQGGGFYSFQKPGGGQDGMFQKQGNQGGYNKREDGYRGRRNQEGGYQKRDRNQDSYGGRRNYPPRQSQRNY